MKLHVLKSDGTAEPYLHTKVLGSFHNAMSLVGQSDLTAAEQMAEAVTFYIHQTGRPAAIPADRIHLMIQAVLASTGFAEAAEAFNQRRLNRSLLRKRLEVISDRQDATIWNKSRLVSDLVQKNRIDRLTARAIAGAVEEKTLKMGITHVRTGLLRELVRQDTQEILTAEEQLATVL